MILKFECGNCGQHIEADEALFGQSAPCPTCGKILTVPTITIASSDSTLREKDESWLYMPPRTAVSTSTTQAKPAKNAEDYAADAICGAAKVGWKATKFIAPFAGRIGAKVAGRATAAAAKAAAPHAKNAVSFFDKLFTQTPEEIARQKRSQRIWTFWTIVITIALCGAAVWIATLPEEIIGQIVGNAAAIVVGVVWLLLLIGFITLVTNKTGQRIIYWLFFR